MYSFTFRDTHMPPGPSARVVLIAAAVTRGGRGVPGRGLRLSRGARGSGPTFLRATKHRLAGSCSTSEGCGPPKGGTSKHWLAGTLRRHGGAATAACCSTEHCTASRGRRGSQRLARGCERASAAAGPDQLVHNVAWGGASVSSGRSHTVQPKVMALVRARFLWHFPYLERVGGVLDGVKRGPTGPLGPLELAALDVACVRGGHCPGREPPFLAVKRPARSYKSAIQKRFTVEYAEAA
jgi:hypothetical protein